MKCNQPGCQAVAFNSETIHRRYCTAHGGGTVTKPEHMLVDLDVEKVDWSRHAFRLGIDPVDFKCLDTSDRKWNALTVDEVAYLRGCLNGAGDILPPGLEAIVEWCEAVLKWKADKR